MKKLNAVSNVAILAGVIALESGAETYRVEETIERIAKSQGMKEVQVFATPTGIFMFIEDDQENGYTRVVRVKNRGIDLSKVTEINDTSRQIVEGKLTIQAAEKVLKDLKSSNRPYGFWLSLLAGGLASASFAFLFGGQLREALVAFVAGFFIQMVSEQSILKNSRFFVSFLGGMLAAFFALLGSVLMTGLNIDKVIIGAIMTLVPGVAITNAIRDVLHQDYISGAARGLESFLVAVAIAASVTLVIGSWLLYGGAILN